MSVTIRLPWPHPFLSPNARKHWRLKASATKQAKRDAWGHALSWGALNCFASYTGEIAATITFCPPDRRKRDRDNMIASFKAYQDGLALATGADDSRWVPTYHVGEPDGLGSVHVTLRARDTGGTG